MHRFDVKSPWNDSHALIERYLAGECTPAEVEQATQLLAGNARLRDDIAALRAAAAVSGAAVDPAVIARVALRSGASMPASVAGPRVQKPAMHRNPPALWGSQIVQRGMGDWGKYTLRRVLWSAGAVVLAVLAFVLVTGRAQRDPVVTRTYATQSGQQSTFTLIEGTRVTLAPRTTLRLTQFGALSRQVDLDGQAYFEVTRSAQVPFRVRTGAFATQVLGTAFLVRHYADDQQLHVAVADGKVSVVPNVSETSARSRVADGHRTRLLGTGASEAPRYVSWPLLLTAGHIGDITDSTVLVNTVNDLSAETDWLRGSLVFRHTPVSEVLQTLSRWYGYQFRCSDSAIVRRSVTLALNAQSSAKALETLEQILSVHLTITGDTIKLSPHTTPVPGANVRTRAYDIWIPTREAGR